MIFEYHRHSTHRKSVKVPKIAKEFTESHMTTFEEFGGIISREIKFIIIKASKSRKISSFFYFSCKDSFSKDSVKEIISGIF